MDIDKVITRRLNEIDNQYRQAVRQLEGLNNTIISLQKYASQEIYLIRCLSVYSQTDILPMMC